MKLQKQRTREVKGKEYHRWTIVISPKRVKELGWKEGEELEDILEKDKLIIVRLHQNDKSKD